MRREQGDWRCTISCRRATTARRCACRFVSFRWDGFERCRGACIGDIGEPVKTFNVGFEEAELDESAYARAVARALRTDHTEIRITQRDFEGALDASIHSLDQPTFDGLNTYLVSRAVRAAGIRVALGGTGGDDVFGGNRTFVEIPFVAKWGARFAPVPEPLLRSAARVVTRLKTGHGTIPAQARWGKLGDVLAAKGNLFDLYQLTYGLFTSEFIARLLVRPSSQELRAGVPRAYADEIEAAVVRNPELYAISLMGQLISSWVRSCYATWIRRAARLASKSGFHFWTTV